MRSIPLVLASLLALGGTARASGLELRVEPDPVRADEGFHWNASLLLRNATDRGLFLDSLLIVITARDSGRAGGETVTRRRLAVLSSDFSAGDSTIQTFSGPATCEHGELRVLAWAHTGEGRVLAGEAAATLAPGPFSEAHASRFFTSEGRGIEYVLARPDSIPSRGAPAVLLVSGPVANARRLLPLAQSLTRNGFVAMAVSPPGCGLSEGEPDLMGPATVQTLSDAVDLLRREPGVDRARIGAWGVSQGAGCVVSLAARRKDLAGVVAQSGSYDLWATYRQTQAADLRESILALAGRDSAAWRVRSPLLEADHAAAPVLILHGDADDRMPVGPAHALQERLEALGRPVEARFFARGGHLLPQGQAQGAAIEFLKRLPAR
jgi:dipeptidyl aminopeptidase/acylaminoacyl peptidase